MVAAICDGQQNKGVWRRAGSGETTEGAAHTHTHSRSMSRRSPEPLDLCRRLCWMAYLTKYTSDESLDMRFWPPDASLILWCMRMEACTWKRRFMLARGM